MGTYYTKGSQNTPKIKWRSTGSPLSFFCFLFFFSPFVRPHATNKILSTGKKKKYRAMEMGDGS